MAVQNKLLYVFRGWIAFVAFVDLGTAGRSYVERRSFLGAEDAATSRMLGMFSLLKALALIHCTLYIHFRPVVSLGYWALALTVLLYCSEAFYFQSAALSFSLVFPCVINALTLAGLVYVPGAVKLWGPPLPGEGEPDDENSLLLRQLGQRPRHKRRIKP